MLAASGGTVRVFVFHLLVSHFLFLQKLLCSSPGAVTRIRGETPVHVPTLQLTRVYNNEGSIDTSGVDRPIVSEN